MPVHDLPTQLKRTCFCTIKPLPRNRRMKRVEEMDESDDSCSQAKDKASATTAWYSLALLGRVSSPFLRPVG
jgi:hypothetical protein